MSKLAITCGDPSGVGPEIIFKWLEQNPQRVSEVFLLGCASWLSEVQDTFDVEGQAVGHPDFKATPGQPSVKGAAVALEAMDAAATGCWKDRFRGVVTAPVSKHWLHQAGCKHPGQTEYFAGCWGGTPTMAFAGEKLNVALVTWHIPFSEVVAHLNRESVTRAVDRASWLACALGAKTPRIGVCGLNPHAGEQGLLGSEEEELLNPLLTELRASYPGLSLCQAADTLFMRAVKGEFDIVVALYHDQGLAPLKTIEFDTAVNVTLGLSWIRTSPDHGTGFDIAGKGVADCRSLDNAITLAQRLSSA